MSHASLQHRTARDMARLRRMLERVLAKSGSGPQRASLKRIRILDLGCGSCHEAEVLTGIFPDGAPETSARETRITPTHFVGIDIREREIADASERCRAFQRRRAQDHGSSAARATKFEFLAGNAANLSAHRELPEEFDLVFLRHQNFWDGEATWKEIFRQGLEKLSPGGALILTSYFDREHRLALEAMEQLGGEIVVTEENLRARELPTPGKFVDKHVALVRRKEPGSGIPSADSFPAPHFMR